MATTSLDSRSSRASTSGFRAFCRCEGLFRSSQLRHENVQLGGDPGRLLFHRAIFEQPRHGVLDHP